MEWISLARSSLELHSTSVQLFLVLFAIISAILLRTYCNTSSKGRWPPGPPLTWPIIGHFHLLGKLPHHSLCELSKTYGPLMGMRLGNVPTIVASSPQMAKEILQTHDLTFAYRPRIAAAVHMLFDCSDLSFAPYGPFWKLMRTLCATEVFSAKRLASFKHVREDEVRGLARVLVANLMRRPPGIDEAVELRESLVAVANNITCRMVMGKKITELLGTDQGSGMQELQSLLEESAHLLGVFYIGDYLPWLWWLDPHGYLKRMKAMGQKVKALMQAVMDKRRKEREGQSNPSESLLDVLLAIAADPMQKIRITDDNIMAVIMDLFAAGSDTSGVTVEWALADLISNERVMRKLQDEIDSVVGVERLVAESDMENLPYLSLVVKESMRLHPTVPLLLPHESCKECHIGVYRIPPKTRAYVNIWAIGRDPLLWERPLEFWPERFEGLDDIGKNFEFLPFGAGRRVCPGSTLGLLNAQLMLATLVQGFNFSLVSSSSPNHQLHTPSLDVSERFGLVLAMDKPLHVFLTPRLPVHMY